MSPRLLTTSGVFAAAWLAWLSLSLSSNIAFAQQPGIVVNGESSTQRVEVVQPNVVVAPPEAPRIIISSAQSGATTGVVPPEGFEQLLPRRIIIASAQSDARTDLRPRPPVPGGTGPGTRIKFPGAQQEQRISWPTPALPPVFPVSVGPPQRVVIFVQGITSESHCPTGQGFLNRAPIWLEDYLQSDPLIKSQVEVVDYAYFSYNSAYCNNGNGQDGAVPDYRAMDTCSGDISGAYATGLKDLIQSVTDKLPGVKVTLVAHSQGGFLTAHVIGSLIANDPDFVKQRIASAIIIDSFPKGVPQGPARIGISAVEVYFRFGGCGFLPDLSQWVSGQPVADAAAQAAMPFNHDQYQVAFYTLDAANGPMIAQWTQIRGSRHHELIPNAGHNEIWDLSTPRKLQLVGCAVILTHACNLSQDNNQLMPGQNQVIRAEVPAGSRRVSFSISWSGGTVKLTPIAPNGLRMDSGNLPFGSLHRVGADFETYELIGPPAGDWTLELLGEDVPAGGEPVAVLIDVEGPPNEPPFAVAGICICYQANEGDAVALSALDSSDPDGQIEQYEWDLDADGQYDASGVTINLVVDDNGQFIVGLQVTDNSGGTDATTTEVVVNNVPPTLTAGAERSVILGEDLQVELASFTDPGIVDTHTASIDWGDGTPVDDGIITLQSPGTPGRVGGLVTGSHTYDNSGEFTVAIEVCDDDLGCASASLQVMVIGSGAAEPSLNLHRDSTDGAIGLKLGVDRVSDPLTDEDLDAALESFQAQLTYDHACLRILAIRDLDFATSSVNIDNGSGVATFNGTTPGGVQVPTGLGHALARLVGSNQNSCTATMQITLLTDHDGNTVTVTNDLVRDLLRGDARADRTINIADAMFIAQGLAGLRAACAATVDAACLHSVNAASVRPDEAFDRMTIADARFIAQYLAGLRDGNYRLVR